MGFFSTNQKTARFPDFFGDTNPNVMRTAPVKHWKASQSVVFSNLRWNGSKLVCFHDLWTVKRCVFCFFFPLGYFSYVYIHVNHIYSYADNTSETFLKPNIYKNSSRIGQPPGPVTDMPTKCPLVTGHGNPSNDAVFQRFSMHAIDAHRRI